MQTLKLNKQNRHDSWNSVLEWLAFAQRIKRYSSFTKSEKPLPYFTRSGHWSLPSAIPLFLTFWVRIQLRHHFPYKLMPAKWTLTFIFTLRFSRHNTQQPNTEVAKPSSLKNGKLMEQAVNFMAQGLAWKADILGCHFDQNTCIYDTGSALLYSENLPLDPMLTKLNPVHAFIQHQILYHPPISRTPTRTYYLLKYVPSLSWLKNNN